MSGTIYLEKCSSSALQSLVDLHFRSSRSKGFYISSLTNENQCCTITDLHANLIFYQSSEFWSRDRSNLRKARCTHSWILIVRRVSRTYILTTASYQSFVLHLCRLIINISETPISFDVKQASRLSERSSRPRCANELVAKQKTNLSIRERCLHSYLRLWGW